MSKKLIIPLIAGAIIGFLAVFFSLNKKEEESKVHIGLRDAYNAACKVESRNRRGSGVLLDTGYILTARHCVDVDGNGRITPNERKVKIEFYGDVAEVTTATVTTVGDSDFALLEPVKKIRSNVSLAKVNPTIGQPINTIGLMDGEPPHITSGFISTPTDSDLSKTSCYISFGNSGGGLFDDKNNVVGIVYAVRMKPVYGTLGMTLPAPGGGWMHVRGRVSHLDELNCMCFYVPINTIRSELEKKHLLVLVDGPEKAPTVSSWNLGLITTILQVLLVVICVIVSGKYIFGQKLC